VTGPEDDDEPLGAGDDCFFLENLKCLLGRLDLLFVVRKDGEEGFASKLVPEAELVRTFW
jgi:hypothetical protein